MPWDPFRDLVAIHERIPAHPVGPGSAWMPPVDVYETATGYVVTAELPGFALTDFRIDATSQTLTLSGRRPPPALPNPQFLRLERGQGDFSRTFTFPEAIDVARVVADFRDGLVSVTVPKGGPAGARRIEIS